MSSDNSMRNEIIEYIRSGQRLEAIFQVRTVYGCDYTTARTFVNTVAASVGEWYWVQ